MLNKYSILGEIMDKKIILSIVIVALIGIVAATYQINMNENLLNPLSSVETEESPVTEALTAPASTGDSANSASNGQQSEQDSQQANQQAAQQTGQDNQQTGQQTDGQTGQDNQQTGQDTQAQSSSSSSGSSLISSDSPIVTSNANSNNGQSSSSNGGQSSSNNNGQSSSDSGRQSNSGNTPSSSGGSGGQTNPSSPSNPSNPNDSNNPTNTITSQQAYTLAVKKVNANFNAPVAIDQSSVTTQTSNGKTYYVFEATTSDNQLIHIYVGKTPDSDGNVDITIQEDSATIDETPDPSNYASDINDTGSDPADAEYNITGQ